MYLILLYILAMFRVYKLTLTIFTYLLFRRVKAIRCSSHIVKEGIYV